MCPAGGRQNVPVSRWLNERDRTRVALPGNQSTLRAPIVVRAAVRDSFQAAASSDCRDGGRRGAVGDGIGRWDGSLAASRSASLVPRARRRTAAELGRVWQPSQRRFSGARLRCHDDASDSVVWVHTATGLWFCVSRREKVRIGCAVFSNSAVRSATCTLRTVRPSVE